MGTCEEFGEAVLYRENGLSTEGRLLTSSMTLSKSTYLSDPQSPLQQSRNNNK